MQEMPFKAPLVVGYKGEIGSFILQGLLRSMPKAKDIWCFDINETEQEKIARIKKSDVIFLCIPMQDTVAWFKKYAKYIRFKTVIEQCSLKEKIYKEIWKNAIKSDFILLSMHILFRPSNTPDKKDRSVALIDYDQWIGSLRLVNAVKEITDSQIVWFSNRKVHDMTMAYQQALVHRILLIMGDMLRGLPGETYISKRVKELEQRIRLGDPILYKLIQKNQYLPEVRKDFNKRLRSFNITKEMKQEK